MLPYMPIERELVSLEFRTFMNVRATPQLPLKIIVVITVVRFFNALDDYCYFRGSETYYLT
jgi:hypothetical protein